MCMRSSICSGFMLFRPFALVLCVLHGESSKRLATPRNTKDKKHLQSTQSALCNYPIGPTDKPHRPSTKHYRKDSPGDA